MDLYLYILLHFDILMFVFSCIKVKKKHKDKIEVKKAVGQTIAIFHSNCQER